MNGTIEARIAHLEAMVEAQATQNMMLFSIIFSRDDGFKAQAAEVLRQALVSPSSSLSPLLELQIRSLRDVLVGPAPEGISDAIRQPSIRPVK